VVGKFVQPEVALADAGGEVCGVCHTFPFRGARLTVSGSAGRDPDARGGGRQRPTGPGVSAAAALLQR
jgi:hypothetical protein